MKTEMLVFVVGCAAVMMGCGGGSGPAPIVEEVEVIEVAETVAPERHDVVYVCNCGDECACGTVAVEPGTCSCGTELKRAHLVKVEGNEGLLCTCDGDCTCTIDPEDATKCSCGTGVRRVSFEGTGLHFCNCGGGSCTCNHVTAAPGRCACGMELTVSG